MLGLSSWAPCCTTPAGAGTMLRPRSASPRCRWTQPVSPPGLVRGGSPPQRCETWSSPRLLVSASTWPVAVPASSWPTPLLHQAAAAVAAAAAAVAVVAVAAANADCAPTMGSQTRRSTACMSRPCTVREQEGAASTKSTAVPMLVQSFSKSRARCSRDRRWEAYLKRTRPRWLRHHGRHRHIHRFFWCRMRFLGAKLIVAPTPV
mmetsp:Transcript_51617/g.131378  ORF Transcript_51617/g.131378 Transcript_51617/m.131378 type:complete len:205 (+) Transcript_51617:2460-3074(+)